jgi:thioredoxin 1
MGKHTFEVTDQSFATDVLASDSYVLVDFWADWCQPCRMIAPFVEEVAEKYEGKLRVAKMDVDAHPNTMMQYDIQGIPTLILFKGGKPVHRIVGFHNGKALEAELVRFVQPETA